MLCLLMCVDLKEIRKDINSHSFINSSNAYLVLPQSIFINVQEINPIALYEETIIPILRRIQYIQKQKKHNHLQPKKSVL